MVDATKESTAGMPVTSPAPADHGGNLRLRIHLPAKIRNLELALLIFACIINGAAGIHAAYHTGRGRLRVRGNAGQVLRLTPAEQRQGMHPRRNDGRGPIDPAISHHDHPVKLWFRISTLPSPVAAPD